MVVSAQNGVEVGTEIGWRYASMEEKPVIFVINHLEHENSNFQETVNQIKSSFQAVFPSCNIPINAGPGLDSLH